MDLTLWLELALFVVLMALSGFFSSSETSLFSLSKLQLEQMRRNDNPRLPLIERLLSEPRRLIVTILIGNEFVNVAASVISAAIVIRILGADNKLVNLFIMVPILLLFGEITPKTLAIRNNIAFATSQSRPIELFARLIKPLRWLVRLIADWFTTLIVGSERSRANIVTEDMVRTLAHEAVGEGVLDKNEARYIDQIFDFGNKTVAEIMTPRSNVFFLSVNTPLPEIVDELRRTRHSKVPIYRGHRDNVVGILHARDLLGLDVEAHLSKKERLGKLLREPYFVPETKSVSELFRAFRKRKRSLALTVDEYGGVTGMVTMEDALECIFGDIPSPSDETDEAEPTIQADGSSRVDGAMSVEQFDREFASHLKTDEAETIGGLVLHLYGELPPEGTTIEIGELEFTVVEVSGNRIRSLSIKDRKSSAEDTTEKPAAAKATTSQPTNGDMPRPDNRPADQGSNE